MDAGRMAPISDATGAVVYLWQAKQHPGAGLVNAPGAFCWNELATRDTDASQRFYSELLGWTFEPSPEAGPAYWLIKNGELWNGGMRRMGPDMPPEVPDHWFVYFAADSVAAAAERAEALGAKLHVPRTEFWVGAFAVVVGPRSGAFALYEGQLDD
jgi:predicted enzyme related to lactoylglutathione lyase